MSASGRIIESRAPWWEKDTRTWVDVPRLHSYEEFGTLDWALIPALALIAAILLALQILR